MRKCENCGANLNSGELKAQKVGNTWYITDKTLTEFITGEKPEKR